ncbi:MAG: hypothetical protein JWQ80_1463 [Massilia sp.]|nr:hypothetical protein [Massilia sp.]
MNASDGACRIQEMRRLNIKTRNRVRAILAAETRKSIELLNNLRAEKSPKEIIQIERVIGYPTFYGKPLLPGLFPGEPQTSEGFNRLENLGFEKELLVLESLVDENLSKIQAFIRNLAELNLEIVNKRFNSASDKIGNMLGRFGHSHVLLRKAVLLRELNSEKLELVAVENLLAAAGLERRNVFLSSLLHCYNEAQDYLGLKKSIMSLPKRGAANRYTRDICRTAFHPIVHNTLDLAEILQSNRQYSILDALIIAKVNSHLLEECQNSIPRLRSLFSEIDQVASVDEIAGMYSDADAEGELAFYKQSSAWLEISGVVEYRMLVDHFYDYPEAEYINLYDDLLLQRVKKCVSSTELSALVTDSPFTKHSGENLQALEMTGTTARSAVFNYLTHVSEGYAKLREPDLIALMDVTRDLAKTVNPDFLRNMVKLADTRLSILVLYFLIAKKSRNELDGHKLRKILQGIAIEYYGASIVRFINALSKMSGAVAEYAYEVCTEDFIAKLFDIVKSTSEITETRAALHKWMGKYTGEQAYLDRARTLLIDHQLNKIRNEIDDNRIYVDSSRFAEWISDEVMRDLNGILTSIEHKNSQLEVEDPQLLQIVEKCYVAFCSNKIFGIASYLGRRIRHGTFKGHLYSSVISIERNEKYKDLLAGGAVSLKWARWKSEYEQRVNGIIRDRLHIESNGKRNGLLKLGLNSPMKYETLAACARYIARDFAESKSSATATQAITEYCWRLAEYDLKEINAFLKQQRAGLINNELLTDLKQAARPAKATLANDFCRDLTRSVDEKLMSMYNWFKRPLNVAPKASLSLLYKAVVAEVRETFDQFQTGTDFEASDDIEVMGGAYHVLYDSLYVIVYNAAKHGKVGEQLQRKFRLVEPGRHTRKLLLLEITSIIKDSETEQYVQQRLTVDPNDDMTDAQVSEDRSGIRKLFHLQQINKNFAIGEVSCRDRKVIVSLAYALEH